jgi:hypothetical protein
VVVGDKHSSLFGLFVSDKEKKFFFYKTDTREMFKNFYVRNLQNFHSKLGCLSFASPSSLV